jgi:hypothetical protein
VADLEYRIGALDIDSARFRLSEKEEKFKAEAFEKLGQSYRYTAVHLFIIDRNNNEALIYVSGQCYRHSHVAGKFDIPNQRIVGGGNCYMDGKGVLILDDFSGDYLAIPKKAAQIFAELIKPKLEEIGLQVMGIAVNPNELKVHPFWSAF